MDTIGRYKIKGEIGRGGMATVYLAYDPRFKRQVAIKVLPRQFTHDPKFLARFEQEATIIAGLEHPAIVPVYDFGDQEDLPYLVMRYMPGGSLARKLVSGPLSLQESARILRYLAPALDKAHERGIIHRDLKPGNVLFDEDNQPYLADFGIARMAEATHTMTIIGTPAYMSPEQVRGKIKIDSRSDIYAIGVMLFEMLTGHQPFEADTPSGQMVMHIMDPIPHISSQNPSLPSEIQTIIERTMAKDREQRYQNTARLSAALDRLVRSAAPGSDPTIIEDASLAAALKEEPKEVGSTSETEIGFRTSTTVVEATPEFQPPYSASILPATPDGDSLVGKQIRHEEKRKLPSWAWWIGILALVAVIAWGFRGFIGGRDDNSTSDIDQAAQEVVMITPESTATTAVEATPTKPAKPTISTANLVESEIIEVTATTEIPEPTAETLPFQEEWETSGHADKEAEAFVHFNNDVPPEIPTNCAKCHSTPGYLDFLGADGSEAGIVNQPAPIGTVVECEACHNDVSPESTDVVFPSSVIITGLGYEADCIRCHQGRHSTVGVNAGFWEAGIDVAENPDVVYEDIGFSNIHYAAAAATQYGTEVLGGYEYSGREYQGRYMHVENTDTCIECHDAHSLEILVDVCADCHGAVRTFNDLRNIRESKIDFDGDDDISEGIRDEILTFRETLYDAIQIYANQVTGTPIVYDEYNYPYFFIDLNEDGRASENETNWENGYNAWTPRLAVAAYNYQFATKDPGAYVHNPYYILQLLYDSIEDLYPSLVVRDPTDFTQFTRPN